MHRYFAVFCSLAVTCAASVSAAIVAAVAFVVDFIGSPFASNPRMAFDGPAAPRTLGGSWLAPNVDRHEAGVSRRSAARNT